MNTRKDNTKTISCLVASLVGRLDELNSGKTVIVHLLPTKSAFVFAQDESLADERQQLPGELVVVNVGKKQVEQLNEL